MLRALKKARFARIALLIAGFLAISGSFGLHPEPEGSQPAHAARQGWTTVDAADGSAPHECLACLSHRNVSLPRLSPVVLQSGSSVPAAAEATPLRMSRLEPHPREGRAPPTLA